jgi:5'-3' exonuclease
MHFDEFYAWFDRFGRSTFRLETLQRYAASEEDERLRAFREGAPASRAVGAHEPVVAADPR